MERIGSKVFGVPAISTFHPEYKERKLKRVRSLFLKIFVWFWVTLVVVGAAIGVSVWYSSRALDARAAAVMSTIFSTEPQNLRQALAAQSRNISATVTAIEEKYPVHAYFFSADDVKFFEAKKVAPEIQKLAVIAFREEGLHAFGTFASQRITDTEGRKYALVIVFAQDTATVKSRLLLFQAPIIMLAAAGLFCFLIARHVTAPLVRLSSAAEAIAQGRLDTRVGLDLQKRHDEIAALARDFDRMAERIETLVTSQQALLANISHELRSPLARLNVALELLKQEGADKNPEHVQRIALEARRLDTLIGHVLMLSRLDSKVLATPPAAIDLAVITQEVLADAAFEARAMSREVVSGAMDNCTMSGHENLLRSAIENVVRNAVRHTPPGTTVDVSLRREITANQSHGVLRVRDHGPGVPESMLEEIFRPFARVPSAGTANVSGSGLGLAIAQRAVAAHGGSIRAQNAPDGGLMIEIELPIA